MKITLNDLLAKKESLDFLADQSIPAIASYKIAKAKRLTDEELNDFFKVRNDLIKKYGKEDKKTGEAAVKGGTPEFEAFIKEVEPLTLEEVELNIEPMDITELGEKFEIAPKYLAALRGFVFKD